MTGADDLAARGPMLAAISNAMVGIHRELYGRGATRAHTIMQGDFVCSLLFELYTAGERTLIDAGKFAIVRDMRQEFQLTAEPRFVAEVEQITGRKVVAFFSQVHTDPDMGLEAFVLEPVA